jgi:hypothetical protein
MAQVKSNELKVNVPVEVPAPDSQLIIVVGDKPLPIGSYTFRLEVVDNSGNRSEAVTRTLFVVDTEAPTAIISAPRSVPFNAEFTLSGKESRDVGGGTIQTFIWTLIQ